MEIRPILSAMTRNKTGAVLVALQIAITLAVVCNAAFIIQQRLDKMSRDPGLDLANIITIQTREYRPGTDNKGTLLADLAALRALPGVVDATAVNSLPLSGGGWSDGVSADPKRDSNASVGVGMHMTDEHGLAAYGLKLAAGRGFRPEEVTWRSRNTTSLPPVALVTKELADKLFPNGDALGKTIYDGGIEHPLVIVGIVEKMQGFWPNWDGLNRNLIIPALSEDDRHMLVIRTKPGERDRLMPVVQKTLHDLDPHRMLRHLDTLQNVAAHTYEDDHAMTVVLSTVIGLLVTVTALGIVGLVAFNVNRRQRQIGMRRALGARRRDVLRYFLLESWLLATLGAALGIVFAIGLSVWLVNSFNLPRLDWRYLPVGVLALWALSQLAALGPARRASLIAPAIATRSV